MTRFAWCFLVALAVSGQAFAHGGIDAAKRSVEASMLVTGEIAVNPDGSVYGYSLDHRDKLPSSVVKLIDQTLTGWKFAPAKIEGKPVLAKAFMSLRIVAKQIDPKHDAISVESAAFGADTARYTTSSACADHSCLTYLKRPPPSYPPGLVQDAVTGTVYLVVQVNPQGNVSQVAVEQVNLRRLADETTLGQWRRELGDVSMAAARHWTFSVPQVGPEAGKSYWVVRVPVNFSVDFMGQMVGHPKYGQWDAYVRGPQNSIPWAVEYSEQIASKGNVDAIPDDGVPFVADPRLALLTPLGGDGRVKPLPEANPGHR